MKDYSDKSYLHPESHAHKLAQAVKYLGRRLATHPRSTFPSIAAEQQTHPRILTAFQRKQELARIAKQRRAA